MVAAVAAVVAVAVAVDARGGRGELCPSTGSGTYLSFG